MQTWRKLRSTDSHGRSVSLAATILMLILPGTVFSQVVDTNRPGFSFTPGVVPVGRWQLETGISYDRFNSSSDSTSLPLAEARFGLTDGVELFVSSVNWVDRTNGTSSSSGLADMAVGTKLALTGAEAKTRMALLFQVSLPVGDSDFTSDRYDPSAAFIWTYNGRVPMAGTVKVSRFREGFQLDNSFKLPFSLGGAHSTFVEWEANLPEGPGNDTHWINGGYQWLLNDRTQLDANAGFGLNDRAGDYRLGAGFSVLF
jgi:hypothetical protein